MPDHSYQLPAAAVFRPEDRQQSRDALRFILTARCLGSLARMVDVLDVDGNLADRETGLYLFLLGLGAAKEAADAFRCIDNQRWFERMIPHSPATAQEMLRDHLERVRRDCNKDDPASVYHKLAAIRRGTGFHWSAGSVEKALDRIWQESAEFTFELPTFVGPLFDGFMQTALALTIQEGLGVPESELQATLHSVADLAAHLRPLGDAAYFALVSRAAKVGT